jgi:tetratricopeptide (TPR) repeat protein/predicted amidohydrolase
MNRGSIDKISRQINKAILEDRHGKHKEALKIIDNAEELSIRLQEYNLWKIRSIKGGILYSLGRFTESLDLSFDALNTYKKIYQADSENDTYKSNVGTMFLNIGNSLYATGRLEEAKDQYEKVLQIQEKRIEKNPENVLNVLYLLDAATTYNNLGNLLKDMGRLEEAKDLYEKALQIYEKLHKTDFKNIEYQLGLGAVLNHLGDLFNNIGRFEEAKNRCERALEIREKLLEVDPKNVVYQSDIAMTLNNLGNVLKNMMHVKDAKYKYEKSLQIYEQLLKLDPENIAYQLYLGIILNNLGILLSEMELIDEAKSRLKKALDINEQLLKEDPNNVMYQSHLAGCRNGLSELLVKESKMEEARLDFQKSLKIRIKLLKNDPENVFYQAFVGTTLNDLGDLLTKMKLVSEGKKAYMQASKIYTKDSYVTRKRKSRSIVSLVATDLTLARDEKDDYQKMTYLKNIISLCKEHKDFFSLQGLEDERKMVVGAGLYAYLQFASMNVKDRGDLDKVINDYSKSIISLNELELNEKSEEIKKLYNSSKNYIEARCLITQALKFETPDLKLIKEAVGKFKSSGNILEKANKCYTIYISLLQVFESIETLEKQNISITDALIDKIISSIPSDINKDIKCLFERIIAILAKKDSRGSGEISLELNDLISNVDSFALRKLFNHMNKKICEYKEEPFKPYCTYKKWKLVIQFDDPEKVKDKLTIKAGETTLFDRTLTVEEIRQNLIEIDYIGKKYIPKSNEKLIFTASKYKKNVVKSIDYLETIEGNDKIRILRQDCNNLCLDQNLRIAAVQLKYHLNVENQVVKVLIDEVYHQKVMAILESLKGKTDIIIFPEFSIPFDYLKEIKEFVNDNKIMVVAGSHYVVDENLKRYEQLFTRKFEEFDLLKNISPIIIPSSKIIHNEKYLGAGMERPVFFDEGMRPGRVNNIFKLQDKLNIGVMICYEFLNTEMRHRLVPMCNIILVPQTNNNPLSFYEMAANDINRPLGRGNTAFVMANGIFTTGDNCSIQGGSTGIALTLDKNSNKLKEDGIIIPVDGAMEQFLLLATINTEFFPAWDGQIGQVPITTKLIHVFEESEILKSSKGNGEEFIKFLSKIKLCKDRIELRELIEANQKDLEQKKKVVKYRKKPLIEQFSPLMNKHIQNLSNLSFEQINNRCSFILIKAS